MKKYFCSIGLLISFISISVHAQDERNYLMAGELQTGKTLMACEEYHIPARSAAESLKQLGDRWFEWTRGEFSLRTKEDARAYVQERKRLFSEQCRWLFEVKKVEDKEFKLRTEYGVEGLAQLEERMVVDGDYFEFLKNELSGKFQFSSATIVPFVEDQSCTVTYSVRLQLEVEELQEYTVKLTSHDGVCIDKVEVRVNIKNFS